MGQLTDILVKSAPVWLRRTVGKAWLSIFGNGIDLIFEQCVQSVEARFASYCTEDSLAKLSAEKSVVRCPSETVEKWRYQVARAWYWQALRGTDRGLKETLERAGVSVSIFHRIAPGGIYTTDTSTRWIMIQSNPKIGPSVLWGATTWGATIWGPQVTIKDLLAFIRQAITVFAPSHWRIMGVWAVTEDPLNEGPVFDDWEGGTTYATSMKIEQLL